MRSVVDQNVVMRRIPVEHCVNIRRLEGNIGKCAGRDQSIGGLFTTPVYRVIILSAKHRLLLPVGSFLVIMWLARPITNRAEKRREVINDSCLKKKRPCRSLNGSVSIK
jgi:hypothetical protein